MSLVRMELLPDTAKKLTVYEHQIKRLMRIINDLPIDGSKRIPRVAAMKKEVYAKVGAEIAYALKDCREVA